MIRFLIISLFLTFFGSVSAQTKLYSSKKTEFSIFSKAPLENIEAINSKAVSMINVSSREIVIRIPISEFLFSNKLMQQHFNENYMESEKYPYATFQGKINETVDFEKTGVYTLSGNGELNIHGISQERNLMGKLTVGKGSFLLESKFEIMIKDHNIEIPKIVFKKIAEKIEVNAVLSYEPYKK